MKPLPYILNPTRLTGPIFDKELRVASRRRRNYVLRCGYALLLTAFIAIVWFANVDYRSLSVNQTAQMAEAGKYVISTITTFQFFALQLLAIALLSTAISDEIYHRTLGPLMSTAITSSQIVLGKLLGRLAQLLMLLAISLPLLAIVRVFGGVPWNYLISTLAITLTAALFAASVSLFFSIRDRRSYVVILRAALALALFYFLIPAATAALLIEQNVLPEKETYQLFYYFNPFLVMFVQTGSMFSPIPLALGGGLYWPLHCAVMLALSAGLLTVCIEMVRTVALRQACGYNDPFHRRREKKIAQRLAAPNTAKQTRKPKKPQRPDNPDRQTTTAIQPIKGSPVFWKELRTPFLRGGRHAAFIGVLVGVFALAASYAHAEHKRILDEEGPHMVYSSLFVLLGLVISVVLPATSITAERESRSWPILLATPLTDAQIIRGKFLGALRRCMPVWLFLAGHILLFTLVRYIHPIALPLVALTIIPLLIFLTGTGLYFSSRLRRTTTAVILNIALALGLWLILPIVAELASNVARSNTPTGQTLHNIADTTILINPVVQAETIMAATAGKMRAHQNTTNLRFRWPGNLPYRNLKRAARALAISALIYTAIGLLATWRAKKRLRKKIF